MATPSFRKGQEAAQEAAKNSGGAQFARTVFFGIKDGEHAVLRFLTDYDDIPIVGQHSMVPTRPAPANFKGTWPQSNTAVCRKDEAFAEMGYADCFICDHVQIKGKAARPQQRQWALAVLREEVQENGRVVGYRDQVRRVAEMKDGQPTGTEYDEKAIVVVNMAYKNFFSTLDGYFSIHHTLLDRDYYIKRSGDSLDTTYQIVPLDPIQLAPTEEYPQGRRFDLREPDLMKRYEPLPDLGAIITARSSDDYFARFFDTRVPQPTTGFGSSNNEATTTGPTMESTSNDVDEARLAEIAQRVKGYSEPTAPAPAPAVAAPAEGMRDFG